MRILHAVYGYKPAYRGGGPIFCIPPVLERLAARGHEVRVVTTNWNLTEPLDVPTDRWIDVSGVMVRYLETRRLSGRRGEAGRRDGFVYAPEMAELLAGEMARTDVAHTHMTFNYPAYALSRSAYTAGVPYCWTLHGLLSPGYLRHKRLKKEVYLRLVDRPMLNRSARLFALTSQEAIDLQSIDAKPRIDIVPNGIEANEFDGGHAPAEFADLTLSATDVVVLFMARLHPFKGILNLVEAFGGVARSYPRAVLVIAGPDELGLESRLRERAAALGCAERVRFAGMVEGARKSALLERADLFALPSRAEGFSIALLEALAARTAILISEGCNFPEAVAAGAGQLTGIDPSSIEASLSALIAEPQRLKAMGERGRELVTARYGWEHVTDLTEQIYSSVIESGRR